MSSRVAAFGLAATMSAWRIKARVRSSSPEKSRSAIRRVAASGFAASSNPVKCSTKAWSWLSRAMRQAIAARPTDCVYSPYIRDQSELNSSRQCGVDKKPLSQRQQLPRQSSSAFIRSSPLITHGAISAIDRRSETDGRSRERRTASAGEGHLVSFQRRDDGSSLAWRVEKDRGCRASILSAASPSLIQEQLPLRLHRR